MSDGVGIATGAGATIATSDRTGAIGGHVQRMHGIGGENFATAQVTVDTTPGGTLIVAARPQRSLLTLLNNSATDLYIGPTGLDATTGFLFPAFSMMELETVGAVYGLEPPGTTGAVTVYVWEDYDS